MSRWIIGIKYANVFPLPVDALAITSFPREIGLKQLFCISVRLLISFLSNESLISS
jgi:hypothetical protein